MASHLKPAEHGTSLIALACLLAVDIPPLWPLTMILRNIG
jgi:Na+-translocating ferredoxin:NAD+ oxidoreductase RnfD subunit